MTTKRLAKAKHWDAFKALKDAHPDDYEAFLDRMYEGEHGWGPHQVSVRIHAATGIHVFHPRITEIKARYSRNEFPV